MGSSNDKEGTPFINSPKPLVVIGISVAGLVGFWWVVKNRVDLASHSYLDPLFPEEIPVGIEKETNLVIKNSDGLPYRHSVQTGVEFKNIKTKKIEDAAIWEIEDNKSGTVSVSIVPKLVGEYEVLITIGNKRIQEAPWKINFISDERLYDDFPIIINPVLTHTELIMFGKHADVKSIKPSHLDYPPLIQSIRDCEQFWPRNVKFLYNICMDYGRSLYFFTDGDDSIPAQIHIYGFTNSGAATPEEREKFFFNLNLKNVKLQIFQEPSPTRSNLLTRVKYELLVRYLLSKGKSEEEAARLSIAILSSTTQHTLRHISSIVIEALPQEYQHQVSFCYFQINVTQQNNSIYLKISLINFVPTTGSWQSSPTRPLSRKDRKKIRAEFEINMENEDDRGVITITMEGNNENFGRVLSDTEKRQRFGIFNGPSQSVIHFKDTSPTW